MALAVMIIAPELQLHMEHDRREPKDILRGFQHAVEGIKCGRGCTCR